MRKPLLIYKDMRNKKNTRTKGKLIRELQLSTTKNGCFTKEMKRTIWIVSDGRAKHRIMNPDCWKKLQWRGHIIRPRNKLQ